MSTYGVTHGVPVVMQKMLTLSFNERIEELSDFQRNAHHKPRGLDLLGSCHQHGNGGLEKDEAKAVELQAAACGYAEGQSSFGLHVWNWHRRPQRQRGADRLCSLAASQPHDSRLHSPRPAPQRGPRPLRSSLLRRHPPGRGRSPWAAASRDSPGGTLLGKDAIYSSEEEAVLDTVLRWVGHDQQARGQQLEALMDLVNLDAVLTATLAEASKSPVVRASDMAMKLVTVMGSALSGNEHPAKCAWHAPRERDTHNMRPRNALHRGAYVRHRHAAWRVLDHPRDDTHAGPADAQKARTRRLQRYNHNCHNTRTAHIHAVLSCLHTWYGMIWYMIAPTAKQNK